MTSKVEGGARTSEKEKEIKESVAQAWSKRSEGEEISLLSGDQARDSGSFEKRNEKERRERTASEGLRAKLESM